MPIDVVCRACKKRLRVPDQFAGKRVRCKDCQSLLLVEDPQAYEPEEVEERPEPRRKRKKKKAKSGGIPIWVFVAGGVGILVVVVFVVVLIVIKPGARKNPGGPIAVDAPPRVIDGPIEPAKMILDCIDALDQVIGAISQIHNPDTMESAKTLLERETTKVNELAAKLNRATWVPKLDKASGSIQVRQIEARLKLLSNEVQSFSARAPMLGIDPARFQHLDNAFNQFRDSLLAFGRALEAKKI
jgi:hypothetical protein